MKTYRATFILTGLFFAGLLTLWWLEYSGVPTETQRRQRLDRVLPELMDVPESGIGRLEIVRDGGTLAFERRGKDRWQMVQPLDVAADPMALEALVRNLKDLRRSQESGTISGPAESYGLARAAAVIRLRRSPADSSSSASSTEPLASLEIGKTIRELTYVRPSGASGIEVIDRRLLAAVNRPQAEWREQNLIPVPTFQATSLAVHRERFDVKAERSRGGRWKLTSPVSAPANGPKIESALAALSAIRVVDGTKGFVADNVTDFTPYGLNPPAATVELTTAAQPDAPLVLQIGRKPADQADRVYVRRGDQDDVVLVSDRFLSEIPSNATAFRSQEVTDLEPAAVSTIRIEAFKTAFNVDRLNDGWALTSPRAEKADTYAVQSLLSQLDGLKTSEFLDPSRVIRPELDPPVMSVKVWESAAGRAGAASAARNKATGEPPSRPPTLSLRIGRHDRLKKTVYGQLEGDTVILALPVALLDGLPRNQYAFRDRGVLALSPAAVTKLTLVREGQATVLEPDRTSSTPNRWRMLAPVQAPADTAAITQLLALLSDLRAEDFAADESADAKLFGLDKPHVVVTWEESPPGRTDEAPSASAAATPATGRLSIGNAVRGKPGSFYASLQGQPFIFTLPARAVQTLLGEFHDNQVISVRPEAVERLVLRLPGRTLSFARARSPQPAAATVGWIADPGTDMRGIDLSRFDDLVTQLAQLRTPRFFQYEGPIPAATGLSHPRLVLELQAAGGKPLQLLRIGETQGGSVLAATGTASSGAVFSLPSAAWNALIQSLTPAMDLPENAFAP